MYNNGPRIVSSGSTMGADPEFFLVDNGNEVIPAQTVIEEPIEATVPGGYPPGSTDIRYGTLAYDNAAVEIRTISGGCLEHEMRHIRVVMEQLAKLRDRFEAMSFAPAVVLPDRIMDDLDSHPELKEFGCSPAKFVDENGKPHQTAAQVDPTECPIRSAGFHVHLGWRPAGTDESRDKFYRRIAQLCDIFVGLPGVVLDRGYTDQSRMRRQILGYGLAGEYRAQPHGFEYRTLGPWPMRHPLWAWWAYSAVRSCASLEVSDYSERVLNAIPRAEVVAAINGVDHVEAKRIWLKAAEVIGEIEAECVQYGGFRIGNDALASRNLGALHYAMVQDNPFTAFKDLGDPVLAWTSYTDHAGGAYASTVRSLSEDHEELESYMSELSPEQAA